MTPSWQILQGDCRDVLRGLPERSAQTCVTSPPYFGLRDYGHEGQIGLEPTPDEFVAALVGVFREVRRVLRDDGTVWLNLGDSYVANGRYDAAYEAKRDRPVSINGGARELAKVGETPRKGMRGVADLKPKDLIGVPWMVAFALRADGWYLRSDIIWAKPNPMPESVTDRPTKAHEYVFLLSKGPRYFYDADAIREPHTTADRDGERVSYPAGSASSHHLDDGHRIGRHGPGLPLNEAGRNKRSVWTVATQPFAGAHFATFPPKLIEPCILAGTSPKACGVCGTAWRRVTAGGESTYVERKALGYDQPANMRPGEFVGHHNGIHPPGMSHDVTPKPKRTVGWESGCDHDDDAGRCVVLDPFNGAGTTGLVALRHDRSYIGVELNADYAEMARRRILDDAPLLNAHSHKEAA